jgi:tRNA A-37 threonylcarbamoyl transferase component Bud32
MLPNRIGRYTIGRKLGEGQDSAVYLARDTVLDRQAAVKILKQYDGDAYQKVLQEARLASSLDHAYICRIYDVGTPNGKGEDRTPPYIAMEYIEGTSLAERLEAGPLDAHTLVRLGMQICDALAYAHDLGVVHGDISAANVLVNEECEAKLVDFGCAAGYKSAGAATVQGDVWALGNLLFHMATGKDALAQMNGREPGELGLRELVSPGLAAIIERCVDTRLAQCYHTAVEVLRDLHADSSPKIETHPPQSGAGRRRTERIMLQIPIRVSSNGGISGDFTEDTHTLIVNSDGALIILRHGAAAEEIIQIINLENLQESDFRVVGLAHQQGEGDATRGVENLDRNRTLWGIDFPPPLENSDPRAGALLQCRRCRKRSFQFLSSTEIRMLDSSGALERLCEKCGVLAEWEYAEEVRSSRKVSPSPASSPMHGLVSPQTLPVPDGLPVPTAPELEQAGGPCGFLPHLLRPRPGVERSNGARTNATP